MILLSGANKKESICHNYCEKLENNKVDNGKLENLTYQSACLLTKQTPSLRLQKCIQYYVNSYDIIIILDIITVFNHLLINDRPRHFCH